MGQPIELILIRNLASRLAVPVFLVDHAGDLVYFNEPAEAVLGRRFDEIRSMPFDEWTTSFQPTVEGRPMDVDEIPLVVALRRSTPTHREFEITAGDGSTRRIKATAFPIVAAGGARVGAVAMFWESEAD